MKLTYTPTSSAALSSLGLVAGSGVVTVLCYRGLMRAEGVELLVLLCLSAFPALTMLAGLLRLVAISSRRVTLDERELHFRQILKNYRVPLADVSRVEARGTHEDEVDTLRVVWTGVPFYVDTRSIQDFEGFQRALKARIPAEKWQRVSEFVPLNP